MDPGKEKDPPSNVPSKGKKQQSSDAESHGGQLSSSINTSWASGRPRSARPQKKGTISSQDWIMRPSGQHKSVDIGRGGASSKGLLGPYPNPCPQWIPPPCLPPKKRFFKAPQFHEQSAPSTVSGSNVVFPVSAQPHQQQYSNVDVSSKQSASKDSSLTTLMSDVISARRRWHGTNTSTNTEQVGNVITRKKTRLGFGEGLAKYEREKREQALRNAGGISDTAARGSNPPSGAKGDPESYSSSTTEKEVSPQVVGVRDDDDNKTKVMVHPDDVASFTHTGTPPQGENTNLANRSVPETVVCPTAAPASDGCSPGGGFATSTTLQDLPHKLTGQGSNRTESSSAPPEGTVVSGEIFATPHDATSSASNADLSFPNIEGPDFRNLKNENRASAHKIKKDCDSTLAMVQDVPHKLICSDMIENSSAAPQGIMLAVEVIAPLHGGPSSSIRTANKDISLTISKLEEPDLRNLTEKRSCDKEIKKVAQEWKSRTNAMSVCKESTNCITQSCSLLDGDESKTAINTNCGYGECTPDSKQNNFPELCAASNEASDGKMLFKKHSKSKEKCSTVNNSCELGGSGSVQQHNDTVTMEIDTTYTDNNIRRAEKNPQQSVLPGKISCTDSSCLADLMDVEKNDTFLIPEGNGTFHPQQQISNETPRISHLGSSSDPSVLQAASAKSCDVKLDIDLNIPVNLHSENLYSSEVGASTGANASGRATQIDLNIPYSSSWDVASADGGSEKFNLGPNCEQSPPKMPEIKKEPRSFVLFGKVISEAEPSWQRTDTGRKGRSVQMAYGSISGSTARPFQSPKSAFATWAQTPQLNLMHSMMGGDLTYHMVPGSAASSVLNFGPSFTNTSTPQAPGSVTPSRPNGEGSSTRNSR